MLHPEALSHLWERKEGRKEDRKRGGEERRKEGREEERKEGRKEKRIKGYNSLFFHFVTFSIFDFNSRKIFFNLSNKRVRVKS